MLDLIKYGEMLLDAVTSVGDFLLETKINLSVLQPFDFGIDLSFLDSTPGNSELLLEWLGDNVFNKDISLIYFLLGGGLPTAIFARVLKFFVDFIN